MNDITIKFVTEDDFPLYRGWNVTQGDKIAVGLGYDEMIGLICAMTISKDPPSLQWLKTVEEHKAWRDRNENL